MYISNMFFCAQLCTNEYLATNYFSAKGGYFLLTFLFREYNI